MNQLSMIDDSGEALRDLGMQQAVDHADEKVPEWSVMALDSLKRFLKKSPLASSEFMTEEIRLWAYQQDNLPRPPSERAWGGVTAKAAKLGLITRLRIDSVKNPNAHCANANVWRKVA